MKNRLFPASTFLICLMCSSLTAFLFGWLVDYLDIQTGFDSKSFDVSLEVKFALIVLVFPFLETVVFQHLPARLFAYFNGNTYLLVLSSSFLFGLYHFYSLIYIVFGFLLGAIFITFYLKAKKLSFNPLVMTFALHSVHNGLGFLYFEVL